MAEHKSKKRRCKERKEAKAKGIKTKCDCKEQGSTRVSVNINLSGTKEKKERKDGKTRVPRGARVFGGQPRVVYTTLQPAQNNLHSMMNPSTPPMYGSYGVSHNATVGGSRPMSIDSKPLVRHEQSTSYSPPGTPMSLGSPRHQGDLVDEVIKSLEQGEDQRTAMALVPRQRVLSENRTERQRSRSRDKGANPLTHSGPVVLDIRSALPRMPDEGEYHRRLGEQFENNVLLSAQERLNELATQSTGGGE
jgi:hypothetical protein